MATRTITVHDRCTEPGCKRVLHTIAEGERGQCGACWLKKLPADTQKSLNNLLTCALRPTTDAEKDAAVKEALEKLKRDKEGAK